MGQIADEPVRTALDKLKTLSNDDEARRLAFVRERALLGERSLLKDAHDEGLEEGREAKERRPRRDDRSDHAPTANRGEGAAPTGHLPTPAPCFDARRW